MEVKKKKSETTLQQTEMDECHSKFKEMQKQRQCVTTDIKHINTCNTLSKRGDNDSTEIAEQNSETVLFYRNCHLPVNIVYSKEETMQQPFTLQKPRMGPLQKT